MNLKNINSIHFVGIKGVGMAPLAVIAKEAGFAVTGCDVNDEFITDQPLKKAGIIPFTGFDKNHLAGVDLVIATGAHGGLNNPEVIFAKENKIPVLMQGQAVGEFMDGEIFGKKLTGVSVAGCHGKTTTTAMTSTIFKYAGFDPSFIIGTGDIPSLGGSGHFGNGKYFIAEADEYATDPVFDKTPKFLWQYPKYLIITNIEFDHPDLYENLKQIERAYLQLTENIQTNGELIINGDDYATRKLLDNYLGNKRSFGFNSENDYVITHIETSSAGTGFSLLNKSKGFSHNFNIHSTGKHNVLNATAAVIVALEEGISPKVIYGALLSFKGTKRRLEYKGKLSTGAEMYDDYAHHPTEIKATLQGLRELHPDKKIVCIFQPHTFSRTKKLFDDFIYSFNDADEILITDIYASKREQPDPEVKSELLVEAIRKQGKKAFFVPLASDVVKYIKEKRFDGSYCVVSMGAGDIYKIHDWIL